MWSNSWLLDYNFFCWIKCLLRAAGQSPFLSLIMIALRSLLWIWPAIWCSLLITLHIMPCSGIARKPLETMRLLVTSVFGVVFGFFLGVSLPGISLTKVLTIFRTFVVGSFNFYFTLFTAVLDLLFAVQLSVQPHSHPQFHIRGQCLVICYWTYTSS